MQPPGKVVQRPRKVTQHPRKGAAASRKSDAVPPGKVMQHPPERWCSAPRKGDAALYYITSDAASPFRGALRHISGGCCTTFPVGVLGSKGLISAYRVQIEKNEPQNHDQHKMLAYIKVTYPYLKLPLEERFSGLGIVI